MKTRISVLALMGLAAAGSAALRADDEPQAPVPVTVIKTVPASQPEAQQETQRVYGPARRTIIPVEQAQALVAHFKEVYAKLGNPRVVIYVNRDLVDTQSGVKLSSRTERYEQTTSTLKSEVEKGNSSAQAQGQASSSSSAQPAVNVYVNSGSGHASGLPEGKTDATVNTTRTGGQNTYTVKGSEQPSLADKQTTREVERLFGRVFRASGATLADQKLAASLIDDKPVSNLTGTTDQAAKDREALAKIADVAIEILISSRSFTVPGVGGDEVVTVPDVQATAIRLKDAAVLGQASAADILGKDHDAARLAKSFDVRDITEATALALMEDISTHTN